MSYLEMQTISSYPRVDFDRRPGRTGLFSLKEQNLDNLPLERYLTEYNKAGFDLSAEYARRFRLQKKFGGEKGDKIWISGVTDEVTEYAFEYSRKDIVRFPPAYEMVEQRLFAPRFAAFIEEITNPKEREGAVLQGLKEVQHKLTVTPEGSLIIWSSPAGPLGIGNLEYDYSWTHVFYRRGTRVNYVSLRSDFTLSEHARFLNLFLPENKQLNPDNSGMPAIRQILENPVAVLPNSGVNDIKEVGGIMSFIRANYSSVVYKDKQTGKTCSFTEMTANLQGIEEKREQELVAIGDLTEIFERQLLNKDLSEEQILRVMGQYLLSLNYFVRYGYKDYAPSMGYCKINLMKMVDEASSWEMMNYLQSVGGCSGGTRKQNTRTFSSHQSEEIFEGKCPVCKKMVKVNKGERCPKCKTVYACG